MSLTTSAADDRIDMILGVAAIARILGVPRRTAEHLIRTGRLPTGRLGTRVVASRRLLEQVVARALSVTVSGDDRADV